MSFFFFFFFKQKTAYEMLSGDWSSDVCSSDLMRLTSSSRVAGGFHSVHCRTFKNEATHWQSGVNDVRRVESSPAVGDPVVPTKSRRDAAGKSSKRLHLSK